MTDPTQRREPRVRLRAPRDADREAFVAALETSGALHTPWLDPADPPAWFERLLSRNDSPTDRSYFVVRLDDEALVGVYNLSQIVYGPLCSAFLGYYALAPHEGNGYMREGLELLLHQAFGTLSLHRVEANIQPDNAASLALVRGAGFRREGASPRYLRIRDAWRDHERWAITVEDPRQSFASATPGA